MFAVPRYDPKADGESDGGGYAASRADQQTPSDSVTVLSRRKAQRIKHRQDAAAPALQQLDEAEQEAERRKRKAAKREKRQARRSRRQGEGEATEDDLKDGEPERRDAGQQQPSVADLGVLLSLKNSTRKAEGSALSAAVRVSAGTASQVKKGQQRKDPLVRAAERAARKRAREVKERREKGEDVTDADEEENRPGEAPVRPTDEAKEDGEEIRRKKPRTETPLSVHSSSSPSSSDPLPSSSALPEEDEAREQKRLAARPNWMSRGEHVDPSVSCPTSALSLHPHLLSTLQLHGITHFFPIQSAVIPLVLRSGGEFDICVSSPTGSGKCFAAGTRLRLYNGETVAVENLVGGEMLMGDDSSPRLVTPSSLARGRAVLYRIDPHWDGAAAFTVNGDHILVLRNNCRPSKDDRRQREGQWRVRWWTLDGGNNMRRISRRFNGEAEADRCLRDLTERFVPLEWEVSVDSFRASPLSVQRVCRLFQSPPVCFQSSRPRLRQLLNVALGVESNDAQTAWAAWYLGLWISCGLTGDESIDSSNPPIRDRLFRYHTLFAQHRHRHERLSHIDSPSGPQVGCSQLGKSPVSSAVRHLLGCYGLLHEKLIPAGWICDSLEVRRIILAGLIDGSDGGGNCSVVTQQHHLAQGCKLLAGSLGIRTSKIGTTRCVDCKTGGESVCHRVSFTGPMWEVLQHCALSHEHLAQPSATGDVPALDEDEDWRCYGFSIAPQAVSDYYGFAVKGANRRFLLEDFTVTHNVPHSAGPDSGHSPAAAPLLCPFCSLTLDALPASVLLLCAETLIYILPILHALSTRRVMRLRCLVIVPSRDLCRQVGREMDEYARGLGLLVGVSVGGGSFKKEMETLTRRRKVRWSEMVDYREVLKGMGRLDGLGGTANGNDEAQYESAVDVLITTPGRLMDHLDGTPGFTLRHLQFLVIDEVDRLLTQHYNDWTQRVWEEMRKPAPPCSPACPVPLETDAAHSCQRLLLSATLTGNPAKLASLHLHNPVLFTDSQSRQKRFSIPAGLSASFYLCEAKEKPLLLLYLLSSLKLVSGAKQKGGGEKEKRESGDQALVFTSSLDACHRVARLLSLWGGWSSAEYSSALSQGQRAALLSAFRRRSVSVLVCSDVMSRGLDISGVSVVINYDPPVYIQTYIHRIGRTARAGAAGRAVTLIKRAEYGWFVAMARRAANSFMQREREDRAVLAGMEGRYMRVLSRLREVMRAERLGKMGRTEKVEKVEDGDEKEVTAPAEEEESGAQGEEEGKEDGVDEEEWKFDGLSKRRRREANWRNSH